MSLQTLEQKIRKHNPELLKLTFGCEVKIKVQDDWFKDTDRIYHILSEDKSSIQPSYWICELSQAGFHPSCFEIIGHPIQLSHILIAIEKSGNVLEIRSDGRVVGYNDTLGTIRSNINLSIPISQQSPEVIEFINKLID